MADIFFVLVTILGFGVLALCAKGGRTAVNADNAAGLVIVVLLSIYLIVALLFPEKF